LRKILARQAGGQTPPPLRTPEEIRAWLDSLAQFSDKILPLPENISREWIYQEHVQWIRKLLILKAKGVTESNRNRLGVRRFYAKVSDWQHLRQLPTPLGIRRVYATSQGPMPPIP
jgi:hypothetical protein